MAVTRRRFLEGSVALTGAAAAACGSNAGTTTSDAGSPSGTPGAGGTGVGGAGQSSSGQGGLGGAPGQGGQGGPSGQGGPPGPRDAQASGPGGRGGQGGPAGQPDASPRDAQPGVPDATRGSGDGPNAVAKIPLRTLGRTGALVSHLGFGTAPLGSDNSTPEQITRMVSTAIDLGITYLDTAPNYGSPSSRYGTSEMKLKEILRTRRKEVFLVSKVEPGAGTREGVLRQLDAAFRAMGVDQIDLVHIHSVGDWNVSNVLGANGALAGLLEAKKRGLIRFIGTSGHNGIAKFAPIIDTGEIDVTMNTLNFADRATARYAFEEMVLPVARKHKAGIAAMKILGGAVDWRYDGKTAGNFAAHLERSLRYTLDIPDVATAVLGFSNEAEVRQAAALAAAYQPLPMLDKMMLLEQGRALAGTRATFYG